MTVSYPGDSILQSALFAPALRVSMPSRTQSSLSLVKDGGGILFRAKHSTNSSSLYFGCLCVSVNHHLLLIEASLLELRGALIYGPIISH